MDLGIGIWDCGLKKNKSQIRNPKSQIGLGGLTRFELASYAVTVRRFARLSYNPQKNRATRFEMIRFQFKVDVIIPAFAPVEFSDKI
jgi:hypothetical protein